MLLSSFFLRIMHFGCMNFLSLTRLRRTLCDQSVKNTRTILLYKNVLYALLQEDDEISGHGFG